MKNAVEQAIMQSRRIANLMNSTVKKKSHDDTAASAHALANIEYANAYLSAALAAIEELENLPK